MGSHRRHTFVFLRGGCHDGAEEQERLTVENLVELQLAEGLSLADIARLEPRSPGLSAAVSHWLAGID